MHGNIFDAFRNGSEPLLTTKERQEILNLYGYGLVVDGVPGPATKAAIKKADAAVKGWAQKVLDQFKAADDLTKDPTGTYLKGTFPQTVLAIARFYADLKPAVREVGGNNCGPWVRYFADGTEGMSWCALWACGTVLAQAQERWQAEVRPIPWAYKSFLSGWCPSLYESAKLLKRLQPVSKNEHLTPGFLFLTERDTGDAGGQKRIGHVGIVESVDEDGAFWTIEGNAKNSGDGSDGIVRRCRNYLTKAYWTIDLNV